MLPVIALIGQANAGKSTLFNKLTRSKAALVHDTPGLTRDRQYGRSSVGETEFIVVDTGGLFSNTNLESIDHDLVKQTEFAIAEADIILFVVDAQSGHNEVNDRIISMLRRYQKPVELIINKIDLIDPIQAQADYASLGLGEGHLVSAVHNRGVVSLVDQLLQRYAQLFERYSLSDYDDKVNAIKITVVGRPNVGKSTLINRMLGEERVLVSNVAGTTRDSIAIPLVKEDQAYVFIDTAGIRRKGKVHEVVEKFSIIKSLQSIESADVVLMVIDAKTGLVDQDLHLLGLVVNAGKSLIILLNKWDNLTDSEKLSITNSIDRKLNFVHFAEIRKISALHGTGVGKLWSIIQSAYEQSHIRKSPAQLTSMLEEATRINPLPMINGRRIKLRYCHMGGTAPPVFIIHGNQLDQLKTNYKRYLENFFRKTIGLKYTPIVLEFRTSNNPYADKKNQLTPRQQNKRARLLKYVKSKK